MRDKKRSIIFEVIGELLEHVGDNGYRLGCPPFPALVKNRIITFFLGDPDKTLSATITRKGDILKYSIGVVAYKTLFYVRSYSYHIFIMWFNHVTQSAASVTWGRLPR